METTGSAQPALDCELCIIGAGYAGLNGLNAAAKYLKKGDRVVVVDENATWGGQWIGQYDFVRLHQPYRMFTAGDQRWALDREPSYLATRREVLDHLASVPGISAGHLDVRPLFGHSYVGHHIRGARAEVDAVPVAGGDTVRIRARKLLKATGTDVEILPPFPITSSRVRSVAVADPVLMTPEFLDSDAPVYVIGSGKTAMDTVRHVSTRSRTRRPIHLLLGSGMWFFARDNMFPGGRARYRSGTLTGELFLRICALFEGDNEARVLQTLEREGLAMNVFGQAGNCRLGLLSFAECNEIRGAVSEVHRAHLVDVEGTRMVLREGEERREEPVREGSWFVNCTSHFRYFPHEPVLQDSGITCAPQFAMGFTGTSAYYITHAWYRDELAQVAPELFRGRIDVEPKLRLVCHLSLMVMANTALVAPRLPLTIPAKFEGDFHKWYPLYRQLATIARITAKNRDVLRKAERHLGLRYSDAADPS